jgi:hypothetical protein
MHTEPLKIVSTRVPSSLALEIEKAAAQELLTVSSFVRRLLLLAIKAGQNRAAA